jgi:deoxyribodipyrimidine photo-lyase
MNSDNRIANYQEILNRLDNLNPIQYGKSRNFIDGAVANLSPFISRGVIDTKEVLEHLVSKGFTYFQLEKFIQQLSWREYFQSVWQSNGEGINADLKHDQHARITHGMPRAMHERSTGIEAIDKAITLLYKEGTMHNHLRMYTAFLACNLAGFHWKHPAQWMYYHLLDGDWASNALSWQWVAGTFSNKKYIANQENINHYTKSSQRGTYLDTSYEELAILNPPQLLLDQYEPALKTIFPASDELKIDPTLPVFIYNYYNLSPTWRKDEKANRVLLLEPQIFDQYPISTQCMNFALELAKQINGIQVFVGSFEDLKIAALNSPIHYREHPLNNHYEGNKDERNWITSSHNNVQGSFFSFWKKAEKEIRKTYF